jgi:deazaflavin-dependent oxidoreductase (nitroreductase family)
MDAHEPAVEPAPSTPRPGGSESPPGSSATPPGAPDRLPYGPLMTRLLEPLRRLFLVVNRWFTAPAIRVGLGPLLVSQFGGSMLVLRTRGRTSGLVREAPLGYTILDGAIVVVAGYGRAAHWFRNVEAEPAVEVALPGAVVAGRAEEITDPVAWERAFRQLVADLGVVGGLTVPDLATATPERIAALRAALPVVRIEVGGMRRGPYDPGGRFWIVSSGAAIGLLALVAAALRRPRWNDAAIRGRLAGRH